MIGSKRKISFFVGLTHAAQEMSAFQFFLNVFIISLKDGSVVRFEPGEYSTAFRMWLQSHKVREVIAA